MKLASRIRTSIVRSVALGGALSLGLVACATPGDPDPGGAAGPSIELNVVSWATPKSLSEVMGNWWYDEVEARSDGRITFAVAAADSLCSSSEIPECVRDGRADIGQTITDYSSQLFPMATIASIPFLSPGGEAVSKAIRDLSEEHAGAAELWERNNLKPLSHLPPGRLLIGSNEAITTIDDLEGLRMRMAGRFAQYAVEAINASSVAIPAPETYEAMERGVADVAGFPLEGTAAYQLRDVLPHWTDPGVGMYTTIGMWMNHEVYTGLDPELRRIIDEVTEEFNETKSHEFFTEVSETQCDELLDTVGDLGQWADSETERWVSAIDEDLEALWVEEAESDGLEDAAGYLASYKEKLAEYDDPDAPDPTLVCADRN
ncbi:TRAP transporter solute receptor, unknown substrate 3 [Leucobacter sp. 7(1)]|uniref:TRAP transporter substrate-binding protein DctP n=1 Tax=Leucobacter sp. 7(1) TaxID=1255613 RepID=UPI00097E96E6|nr:TRAP transporter substrate-binding protein DctP [Leucobacter sp. 7(1)]SJN11590.1 TRAP transporter solute receptor, unknown substrate 3 [Leucobacter sp. 7(1)]